MKKEWSISETESFYKNLLVKALETIPESGAAMVLGPMFIIRTPEENFSLFRKAHSELKEKGHHVFDQLPLLDYNLPEAPFNYGVKFEIFYKGLIESGRIKSCYLLPDWDKSKGTLSEIEYCKKAGVLVFNIKDISKNKSMKNITTMQKNILITLAVIVVALTGYRLVTGPANPNEPTDRQKNCAIEITALILEDKNRQFKTSEEITRAMFDHYFSFYKEIPKCPTDYLADYKLQSVGKITETSKETNAFTAEITFDLKPVSMDKTLWKDASSTVDGEWIRGKKGILSLRTSIATSSAATTTHYMSI